MTENRVLFVMHTNTFVYGASRSLLHLANSLDDEYDVIIRKSISNPINELEIRKLFSPNLRNVYTFWLPIRRAYVYDRMDLKGEMLLWINNVIAFFSKIKFNRLFKREKYRYVHLNSIILYPLINKKIPFILHVREVLDQKYPFSHFLRRKVSQAKGIIYIDDATRQSGEKYNFHIPYVVINNPFNMKKVESINYEQAVQRHGLEPHNIIFGMLGQIIETKGSKFIIEAFKLLKNTNAKLIIAGDKNNNFAKECMDIAGDDPRIKFIGEVSDTGSIYRICDYILRGENQFCIGRTIFEGLFSGCDVIMPGEDEDMERVPDFAGFEHKIHLYTPSDQQCLLNILEKCALKKQFNRKFCSNIDDFKNHYDEFIKELL